MNPTLLIAALLMASGCAGGQTATSEPSPSQSPGSGLVLLNDTQSTVSLSGCQGCDGGVEMKPGDRHAFELKENTITVRLSSAETTSCLVVVNGVGNGDLLLRASEARAGAC